MQQVRHTYLVCDQHIGMVPDEGEKEGGGHVGFDLQRVKFGSSRTGFARPKKTWLDMSTNWVRIMEHSSDLDAAMKTRARSKTHQAGVIHARYATR